MTITHAFSGALLHFVWQGIVVALLVRIVLYGLRKRSANVRYAVCCAALVMLTALPAITTWLLLEGGHPATAVRAVATVGLLPSVPAVVPAPVRAPIGLGGFRCGPCRSGRSACFFARCAWRGDVHRLRCCGGAERWREIGFSPW